MSVMPFRPPRDRGPPWRDQERKSDIAASSRTMPRSKQRLARMRPWRRRRTPGHWQLRFIELIPFTDVFGTALLQYVFHRLGLADQYVRKEQHNAGCNGPSALGLLGERFQQDC